MLLLTRNQHLRPGALPESGSSPQHRSRLATCVGVPKKSVSKVFKMHSVCSSKVRGLFILDACCQVFAFPQNKQVSAQQEVRTAGKLEATTSVLSKVSLMGHVVLERVLPLFFKTSCQKHGTSLKSSPTQTGETF